MFDARQYQSKMTEFEYATWILDFIFDTKQVHQDFISIFSANPSTLELEPEQSSIKMDRVSLYEMEVYEIIRDTMNRYKDDNKNENNPECLDITDVIKKQEADSNSTISIDGDSDCVDDGTNNCEID